MSTLRAFRPSGGRNAPTASETASMPVSDAPPLANARSRMKIMAPLIRPSELEPRWYAPCSVAGSDTGRLPATSRMSPTTIIRMTTPANR